MEKTTSKSVFQAALEEVADNGDGELKVRSYSGRAMYGKECLSVSTKDRYGLGELIAGVLRYAVDNEVSHAELNEIADAFEHMNQDSMGMGMVYYFPGVPFVKNEKAAAKEEDA